jgi:hypothetical protein
VRHGEEGRGPRGRKTDFFFFKETPERIEGSSWASVTAQ